MLSRIARRFHLPEEKLRSRLDALRREATAAHVAAVSATSTTTAESHKPPTPAAPHCRSAAWDRGVLELIILGSDVCAASGRSASTQRDFTRPPPGEFTSPVAASQKKRTQGDFGRLLAEFDEPEMKSLLVQLDESCATKGTADRERWLADLLETHRRRDEEKDRRTYLAAARQSADNAEQLLAEFCEQAKSKTPQRLRKEKEVS